MDHLGPAFPGPLDRRTADGEGRLGMDDVELLVLKMLDEFFIPARQAQAVFGVEKQIEGRKPVDLETGFFIDVIGKGRGVNMDFMTQFVKFFREDLGGGRNPVDAGVVGVGDEGDIQ